MHGQVTLLKGSTPLCTLTAEQGQATATEHGMHIFGENAILDRRPRAHTCKVLAETTLLCFRSSSGRQRRSRCLTSSAAAKGKEIRQADLG